LILRVAPLTPIARLVEMRAHEKNILIVMMVMVSSQAGVFALEEGAY
jgi:hypothetical protein